jgi:hypothetical protein
VTPERNGSSALSSDANELLDELWRYAHASHERDISRELLRTVARHVSLDAHRLGLRSEELIISLKQSWRVDERRRAGERQRLQWVLSEMISTCIEEFYSTFHKSRSARPPSGVVPSGVADPCEQIP